MATPTSNPPSRGPFTESAPQQSPLPIGYVQIMITPRMAQQYLAALALSSPQERKLALSTVPSFGEMKAHGGTGSTVLPLDIGFWHGHTVPLNTPVGAKNLKQMTMGQVLFSFSQTEVLAVITALLRAIHEPGWSFDPCWVVAVRRQRRPHNGMWFADFSESTPDYVITALLEFDRRVLVTPTMDTNTATTTTTAIVVFPDREDLIRWCDTRDAISAQIASTIPDFIGSHHGLKPLTIEMSTKGSTQQATAAPEVEDDGDDDDDDEDDDDDDDDDGAAVP